MRWTLFSFFILAQVVLIGQSDNWYRFNTLGEYANAYTIGKKKSLVTLSYNQSRVKIESLIQDLENSIEGNRYGAAIQYGLFERLDLILNTYYLRGNYYENDLIFKGDRRVNRMEIGGKYRIYKGKKWIPSIAINLSYVYQSESSDFVSSPFNQYYMDGSIQLTSRITDRFLATLNIASGFGGQIEYLVFKNLSLRAGYFDFFGQGIDPQPSDNIFFIEGSFWFWEDLNLSVGAGNSLLRTYDYGSGETAEYDGLFFHGKMAWRMNWEK